jgi:hypothetical protein
MSLDVYLSAVVTERRPVFSANITHNLHRMAAAAGIADHLWSPEEMGITKAAQLVEPIRAGLARMKADPDKFRVFDAPNGWGTYDQFVPWIEHYLAALEENPDAVVEASR